MFKDMKLMVPMLLLITLSASAMDFDKDSLRETLSRGANNFGYGLAETLNEPLTYAVPVGSVVINCIYKLGSEPHKSYSIAQGIQNALPITLFNTGLTTVRNTLKKENIYPTNSFARTLFEHPCALFILGKLGLAFRNFSSLDNEQRNLLVVATGITSIYVVSNWASKYLDKPSLFEQLKTKFHAWNKSSRSSSLSKFGYKTREEN